jgi:glutamate/aspartate transport system substrate-binding protein
VVALMSLPLCAQEGPVYSLGVSGSQAIANLLLGEISMSRWLTTLFLTVLLVSPVFGQQQQSTLDKIKKTKTITLGYRESSYPFSFLGEDKKPTGYSVDLCTRIAAGVQQQLGLGDLSSKWVVVTPENRISMVADGTVDLECGSTTNTLSRQEQVDFSAMTFVDGGSLLVHANANVNRLSDIAGKRVAVVPGTTTEKVMAEALKKANLTVQMVNVKEHADGIAALENGTADAYASDRVILLGLAMASKDPSQLALADQYFSYEPYGLMLRRGDPDFRLAVDRVLAQLYRSSEIVPVYERWFGSFARTSNLLQAMYLLNSLPE